MKKIITIVLLACTLILSFASCDSSVSDSNNDSVDIPPQKTPQEEAEDLIDSVTDAQSCYEAAQAFYTLTKEEQDAVSNYYVLKEKMKTYSSDSRIRDYLMEDDAAAESQGFHNRLRNKLLNISSYTVNSQDTVVFFDDATSNYYLYIVIDYSAQNKMGGYSRSENNANYYVWKDNSWREIPYSSDEDIQLVKNIYTWQFEEYTRYYFTYSAD